MAIFQKSVINKHLTNLDKEQVEKAYLKFKENYSPAKIEKIKQLKEEEYQDGFLRDLFVDVFGYTLKPDDNYNLVRKFKNQADGKKADGAIIDNNGVYPVALAVIELKSTKTKDLKSITEQAFNYKNNQSDCKYVITSNFQKLRFYIDYANEYEEFDLFYLNKEDFELLYLILKKESIFSNLPLKLKEETKFHEQEVSDKLYKDYSHFKRKLFENLTKNHPESDKLILFKKSQKLIDRFLFILFAEDSGLLPPNSIPRIVKRFEILKDEDAYKPLYDIFKQYFGYMNVGRKGKTSADNIPAYNGGLFFTDELLDNLKIDDEILIDDLLRLSEYDFNTEVDVNILGHIFEHSLSEIEEITAELSATADTKGHLPRGHVPLTSKRKKDGVFYTPKYITQYIVENTIRTLCNEKRKELDIEEIEFDGTYRTKDGKLLAKGKKLYQKLKSYKDWLLLLKVVDPACGSGAFLNQALNFLIQEHQNIDDIIAELTNSPLRLFDVDKTILENNLYGVDINEESVEIAKLSLWLRTAQKGRELSVLSNNIKCGNSLIDDPEVAGEKAFDWNKEFPQVFSKKEKKAWHITTATHNSRYSQRMFDNHVKLGEAIWMSEQDEIHVTGIVADIVKEDNLNVIEYNICGDHLHLLLVCEEEEMPKIVGKLKAVSGRKYNIEKGITVPATTGEREESERDEGDEETVEGTATRGHVPLSSNDTETVIDAESNSDSSTNTKKEKKKYNSLWTQKFGKRKITDDNDLRNVINYILTNRQKHELPENKKLEKIISEMTCSVEHAFRAEYKGGFDVVIGNPPYVDNRGFNKNALKFLYNAFPSSFEKSGTDKFKTTKLNLIAPFIELNKHILKTGGHTSYIFHKNIFKTNSYTSIRKFILTNFDIKILTDWGAGQFKDVIAETATFILKKGSVLDDIINVEFYSLAEKTQENNQLQSVFLNSDEYIFGIYASLDDRKILKSIEKNSEFLKKYVTINNGIVTGNDKLFLSDFKVNESYKKIVRGKNIKRYNYLSEEEFILYNKENLLRARDENIFKANEKLIMQMININFVLTYDNNQYYNLGTTYAITNKSKLSIKYLLSVLNSVLINYYYKKKFTNDSSLTNAISTQNLFNIPIKEISQKQQQPFIEKANKMLELNKQLQEKKTKFLNRVKDNLATTAPTRANDPLANVPLANVPLTMTIKISKKLDTFYDYDFKSFIAELKKQKIKLSLVQQDEWEEYFTFYKNEINKLQDEIKTTDKEIDRMVYELYGLSEEEIKIIEN